MTRSKVAVIVLNWNGWQHTISCFETLFQSVHEDYEVILLDNGSDPVSLEKINEWVNARMPLGPTQIYRYANVSKALNESVQGRANQSLTIIRSDVNLGFAKGCNVGIEYAFMDMAVKYIMLLNNDMKIDKNCMACLVDQADADELAGACQPKVLLSREYKRIDAVGISVTWYGKAFQIGHGQSDHGQYDQARIIYGACAGAVLYRRRMLEDVGIFDEDFFAYYEDVDLSLRARKAGWKALYVPAAVVHHFHSASLGEHSPQKWYYCLRNSIFFVVKNLPVLSMVFFFLFFYPLLVLTTLWRIRKGKGGLKAVFSAVKDGFSGIAFSFGKRHALLKDHKKAGRS